MKKAVPLEPQAFSHELLVPGLSVSGTVGGGGGRGGGGGEGRGGGEGSEGGEGRGAKGGRGGEQRGEGRGGEGSGGEGEVSERRQGVAQVEFSVTSHSRSADYSSVVHNTSTLPSSMTSSITASDDGSPLSPPAAALAS